MKHLANLCGLVLISLATLSASASAQPTPAVDKAWQEQAIQRYQPISNAQMSAARRDVEIQLAYVRELLAGLPDGMSLANEMQFAELDKQLASAKPVQDALELICVRMSRSFPAAVQAPIDELRGKTRVFTDWVGVRNHPQSQAEFTKHVKLLAAELENSNTPEKLNTPAIRAAYDWLVRTHLIDDLLEPIQASFSFPNQILIVHRVYFDKLADQPITQPVNINENSNGVSVRGNGQITAQPAVKFVPNEVKGEVKLEILGRGNVPLVAHKKPATLHAVNRMYFTADQTLLVTSKGVEHREPVVCVRSNTSLQCVNLDLRSRLLKRIATPIVARIAGKQLAKGDPQAAGKAKQQIEKTLREEAFVLIDHVNVLINRIFWQTIDARDVDTNVVVSTTPDMLSWIGEYRSPWQLGAPTAPPGFPTIQPQIVVQMHDSSVNNIAGVAAGKRMNEVVFNEMIFDNMKLVPQHPEPLKPARMPAAFTFADRDPLEMRIEKHQLHARFRIKSFEYDNRIYAAPDQVIRVAYQPQSGPEGMAVVRQGDIKFEPANGPNAKELKACFERFFVPKAVGAQTVSTPAGTSRVKLVHLTFDAGWLSVGFIHPKSLPPSAAK